jgi:CDP-diacylglycerol--inositol 3-phosphatidyltransferase
MKVFLFVPNVVGMPHIQVLRSEVFVGYFRILMLALSCVFMPFRPYLTFALYSISGLLDAVDGHLARRLNQCSQFGQVLDMVIDRSATTCLMAFLLIQYPKWLTLFQLLISIDFTSHYMQMFASVLDGRQSHKSLNRNMNWLLRIYYGNNVCNRFGSGFL